MRKAVYFLLAGALLLGLAACGPATVETPSPDPVADGSATPTPDLTPESPTPTPTLEPFVVQEADVPPGEYEPWQEAYIEYLNQRCEEEAPLIAWAKTATSEEVKADQKKWDASNTASYHYVLCDVDKDGVPELFIDQGDLSSPVYECYTFRDGKVAFLGELIETCASFYNWPGENALLVHWGRMFYWGYSKYSIVNGELVCQGILHEEELVDGQIVGHKEVEEVVPGATHVDREYTRTIRDWDGKGVIAPQVLPICNYGTTSPWKNPTPMEKADVRAAIGKVLWEGEPFFGVSGDGQYGNTGWTTFEEYRTAEGAAPYADAWLVPWRYAFADVNGDGQEDCIVELTNKISYMDLDGDGQEEQIILNYDQTVFSVQDGTVYAYFFSYPMDAVALPDGTFYFTPWYKDYSISVCFFGNQCDTIYVPSPLEGDNLAWEKFFPAE